MNIYIMMMIDQMLNQHYTYKMLNQHYTYKMVDHHHYIYVHLYLILDMLKIFAPFSFIEVV
jgi:hypothetical protein